MGLYILIFEIFIIVIYGIFVRNGTDSFSISYYYLERPIYFTLAFTLLSMKFRMHDWSQITNYLFILTMSFQMNTLYFILWKDCFYQSFSSTQTITHHILITNIQCALAVLVTSFQFTGQLTNSQIFALSMIEIFAFALNFCVNQFGVKAITAGGTMTIFMFGYLFSVPIRKFCCDEQQQIEQQKQQRYFTSTLSMIGLVACIILWPNFNYTTAIIDEQFLPKIGLLKSTPYLKEQGFIHMILGFCAAICSIFGLRIYGEKIVLQKFITTIFLTGIFLSSSTSVIIDPFASILMGFFGPLLSYFIEKCFSCLLRKGYPIQGIIFSILGGIFDSIFTGGRNNRTPQLAQNHIKQGGLQFACLVVSALMAIAFGFLATLILRCFNPRQSVNKDNMLWFVDQEDLPIYPDEPILKRIMGSKATKTLKQEDGLFNLKKSFISEKARQNMQLGKIIKQNVDDQSRIK